MKKYLLISGILLVTALCAHAQSVEVSGSATVNIIPDRITVEIGMEEYYKHKTPGDSAVVSMQDIEKGVRRVLREAGVPDSLIVVSDVGNYRDNSRNATFLMAKRLSATLGDFSQIDRIAGRLDRKGVTSFRITATDNSDMERYNRQGLKAALDAARQKVEFIAQNEGLVVLGPTTIVDTTGAPAQYSAFSNVDYAAGSGMENMRRIVRRYSVKVVYLCNQKN